MCQTLRVDGIDTVVRFDNPASLEPAALVQQNDDSRINSNAAGDIFESDSTAQETRPTAQGRVLSCCSPVSALGQLFRNLVSHLWRCFKRVEAFVLYVMTGGPLGWNHKRSLCEDKNKHETSPEYTIEEIAAEFSLGTRKGLPEAAILLQRLNHTRMPSNNRHLNYWRKWLQEFPALKVLPEMSSVLIEIGKPKATRDTDPAVQPETESPLRAEKISVLKRRAADMGIEQEKLAEADDADDVRGAICKLINDLEMSADTHDIKRRKKLASVAPLQGPGGILPKKNDSRTQEDTSLATQLFHRSNKEHVVPNEILQTKKNREERKKLTDPHLALLDPNCTFKESWDLAQFFLLLYMAIALPYTVGFSIDDPELFSIAFWMEVATDAYFCYDIYLSFITCYEDDCGNLIISRPVITRR